jgi:hypothetical protein
MSAAENDFELSSFDVGKNVVLLFATPGGQPILADAPANQVTTDRERPLLGQLPAAVAGVGPRLDRDRPGRI